jgi:hypothetical protein
MVTMKITAVFKKIMPRSLESFVDGYRCFGGTYCLSLHFLFYSEAIGKMFVRNIGTLLAGFMLSLHFPLPPWLYSPILGLGRLHETFRLISVSISRTVGRTPWTGDQLIARPLLATDWSSVVTQDSDYLQCYFSPLRYVSATDGHHQVFCLC